MSIREMIEGLDHWISEQVSGYVRICPICFRKAEHCRFLCQRCASFAAQRQYRQWARFQEGIPVLSLYEWNERDHLFFQEYATSLKGGGSAQIYESLASDMLALRAHLKKCAELTVKRKWVIVPAPRRSGALPDHAEELAFQIAKLARVSFLPCLKRRGEGSQKRKSLVSRWAQNSLELKVGRELANDQTLYIFVDDVITTGSTALLAYKSLGKPKHFEIWTLFNRPRLRGPN